MRLHQEWIDYARESRALSDAREYHEANPQIYELFKRFAFEAILAGRERFASTIIYQRIRWYTTVETKGDPWKLNNNYQAFYVRLFEEEFPEHGDFFVKRTSRYDQ